MDGAFIVVLVVAAVAGVIALFCYLEHLRREFWRKVAAKYGLSYTPGDPLGLAQRFDFSVFQQGHGRRAKHTVRGEFEGRPVILFDYTYKTGSGKNQSTHLLSGLIVGMPLLGHCLTVRPESFLDRFAAFFGFDDINFELEVFNRAFRVHCESKKFAYDVFHSGMMEYLLDHRNLYLEWRGRDMLMNFGQRQFDEDRVDAVMDAARGFIERLPSFLLAAQRG